MVKRPAIYSGFSLDESLGLPEGRDQGVITEGANAD